MTHMGVEFDLGIRAPKRRVTSAYSKYFCPPPLSVCNISVQGYERVKLDVAGTVLRVNVWLLEPAAPPLPVSPGQDTADKEKNQRRRKRGIFIWRISGSFRITLER
ncbi:hypothetical protein chiPu_0009010 [Chiloscyllium punctatum]|uniref:Uncharacterized protein n=1 Tax=Chiloscyllium punctatum TaxID=137246 RepID=A0A401SJF9_CHIPU|nr:hypothetical protein [Chiloscyllium punctatum]